MFFRSHRYGFYEGLCAYIYVNCVFFFPLYQGEFKFQGSNLSFKIEEKTAFDIPMSSITQSVVQGKQQVATAAAQPKERKQERS